MRGPWPSVREPEVGAHPTVDFRRRQAGFGAHDFRLSAGEVPDQADRVAARIHGGAAGEVVAEADVAGDQHGKAQTRLHVANLAELPAVDDLLHPGGQRVVAPVEGLDEDAPGLLRRLGHALGFLGVGGHRLLAQHVLARLQRSKRPLAVQAVGQGVVDGVDFGVGEEPVVVAMNAGNPLLAGELPRPGLVARRDGHDLGLRNPPRRPDHRHRRDPCGSEDSDSKGCIGVHRGVIPITDPRLEANGPSRAGAG